MNNDFNKFLEDQLTAYISAYRGLQNFLEDLEEQQL